MGEVRVDVVIEAPPADVWAVLADVGGWGQWNDVMTDGRCDRGEVGGVISFRVALGPGLPVRARLTSWDPERALVWGEDRGRLLRVFHGFELEPVGEGHTRVTHFESFRGALGRLVWPLIGRSLRRTHPAFLDALKRRVEA